MSYQPLWLRDLAAYSIQAAMLVGVGAVMASLLRLRVPQVRLAYWQALLAACVFLPLLQPWRPEILESSGTALSDVTFAAPAAAAPLGPSLAEVVLWLICIGIVVRLVWMALGFGRLWLYRRHAERMRQTPESVGEAQRLVPVSPAFFLSRQIPTPATFGFFRPAVLFPARFLQMEPAMQKAVALHELLHVERRDWLWNMLEEIVLTLLWFHLPLWWVVRSARLSREQVVDAEAVRRSHERRSYLKALLEMAGQKWLAESLPAPLFLRENQLAERVALMMKEVHMSRTRLMVSILTAAATLLMAGVTMVWAFPLKTSAPQAESPATASQPAENGDGTNQYQGKDYKFFGKVYKVGGDVEAPVPIYKPEPPYTPEAKKAHLSGPVVLWAIIDTKGEVAETKEQSKPLGRGLDENALKTVRTWKFKPAMRHGVPVPAKVMVEVYFRYFNGDKPDAGSQKADPASDPPAQGNKSASTNTESNYKVDVNQDEILRQIDEAMKHAQMVQDSGVKIDQAKIQEQIDQAMKQLKLAEAAAPKIDEAKVKEQIDQAMKQIQMSQDLAPKIDQEKLQEQINQAMKQIEKMNSPEMRQHMQEQMEQLNKMNTPEMRRQIEEATKRVQQLNTPEMRQHLQEQMDQLKKMNTPEMRQRLKQAMEQAMMAQESAQKMNKDEIERQLEQAKKEAQDAREEAQKARQRAMKDAQAAREEAQKARQKAMEARREAEEQRKAAKPRPSAEPKPVPAPPKEAAPAPPAPPASPATPAPPAPPKTPESAGIVRGVPGGVVGGVPGGIVGGVPGGVVGGVPGGKVTGVQGDIVKGVDGGLAIGVPGGISGSVITAPKPPVPPSTSPKEEAPSPPASPAPSSSPPN
ncbi:MAG TPA: TonB family protein [Terriglobia bacterium]|nr:TonB family protein [Terriglobia bacterium]